MIGVLLPLLLRAASATVCDVDAATLLQKPALERGVKELAIQHSFGYEHAIRTFVGLICVVLIFTVWEFTAGFSNRASTVGISDQWWLIIMSAMIQVVSGSIYAMGTWQNDLRDSLELSMEDASVIGAMTFIGSAAGFFGGILFDRLGPRAAVSLGACCLSMGYCLIAIVVLSGFRSDLKFLLAATGFLLVGYASTCLLDNVVCMACSISFPQNRAAVIGYLKAVLAAAGGLWALLWVQVFRDQFGLVPFLAFSAVASFLVGVASLSSMKILPPHCRESFQGQGETARTFILLFLLTTLTCFDVMAGYRYSQGQTSSGTWTGMTAVTLQMSLLTLTSAWAVVPLWFRCGPLLLLATVKEPLGDLHIQQAVPPSPKGLPFRMAFLGLDFWLLWACQFAVSGAGLATNQNVAPWEQWMALILESIGYDSANSLGASLFALTSSFARVVVGILSDKYQAHFTRFHWLTAAEIQRFVVHNLFSYFPRVIQQSIMVGTFLVGLSFGSFYTVVVPVVNEMYGALEFGKIWGFQMSSQARNSVVGAWWLISS
eukprot:Skav225732  [mRNA]  locus=scaffold611:109806:118672:+ [translate_table: standard]